MILKIYRWKIEDVVYLDGEQFIFPTIMKDEDVKIKFFVTGNPDEQAFYLKKPFTIFVMENGKTIDTIQMCEGYNKQEMNK